MQMWITHLLFPMCRSPPYRSILIAISVLLLVPLLFKVERFGQFLKISMTRPEASEIAKHNLEQKGVDWHLFQNVEYSRQTLDTTAAQYVLKYAGVPTLNQVVSEKVKCFFWVARFYKPLEEEEYRIYIDLDDKNVTFVEHQISENAAGASLDRSSALRLAQGFLRQKGISLETLELKETNSEKRKARLDYSFVWESKVDRIREAAVRWEVNIKGDEVSGSSNFIKVPEEWQREREKSTVADTLLAGIRTVAIAPHLRLGPVDFSRKSPPGACSVGPGDRGQRRSSYSPTSKQREWLDKPVLNTTPLPSRPVFLSRAGSAASSFRKSFSFSISRCFSG